MDIQNIGGYLGGFIGVLGGAVGTYFSIRNTKSPAERRFLVRAAVGMWLGVSIFLVILFALPGEKRWIVWILYPFILVPTIVYLNRKQLALRREAEKGEMAADEGRI